MLEISRPKRKAAHDILGKHLRLAVPFAKRVLLAYDIPGRTGSRYRVVGRPIPVAHRGATRDEGRRLFGLPVDGPIVAVFGALVNSRVGDTAEPDPTALSGAIHLVFVGILGIAVLLTVSSALMPRAEKADKADSAP